MQNVDWTNDGTTYDEDVAGALRRDRRRPRRSPTGRASSCCTRSSRWPAPNAQNTGKAHGSALGDDEVAATKKILGFDPEQTFEVADRRDRAHPRALVERGQGRAGRVETGVRRVGRGQPRPARPVRAAADRELPAGWDDALPTFDADPKGMATREASGKVINAIAPQLPELWGGSADLAESNNTTIEGAAVVPARGPRHQDVAGRPATAGCCTSASASTAWARS